MRRYIKPEFLSYNTLSLKTGSESLKLIIIIMISAQTHLSNADAVIVEPEQLCAKSS